MADIQKWLNEIKNEDLGENVRWPIHDSLDALNKDLAAQVSGLASSMSSFRNATQADIDDFRQALATTQIGDDITVALLNAAISSVSVNVLAFYGAVEPEDEDNPQAKGWYERSGEYPDFVYTPTTDTIVDEEKTYYAPTDKNGGESGNAIKAAFYEAAMTGQFVYFPSGTYYSKHVIPLVYGDPNDQDKYITPAGILGAGHSETILEMTFDTGGWMLFRNKSSYSKETVKYYDSDSNDERYVLREVPVSEENGVVSTRDDYFPIERLQSNVSWYNSIDEFINTVPKTGTMHAINFNGGLAPHYDAEQGKNIYDNYDNAPGDVRCEHMIFANFCIDHSKETTQGEYFDSPDGIRGKFFNCGFYNIRIRSLSWGTCLNFAPYIGKTGSTAHNDRATYINNFYNVSLWNSRCGIQGRSEFNAMYFYGLLIQGCKNGILMLGNSRAVSIIGGDFERISNSCIIFRDAKNLQIEGCYAETFKKFIEYAADNQQYSSEPSTVNINNNYIYALNKPSTVTPGTNDIEPDSYGWLCYMKEAAPGGGRFLRYDINTTDGTVALHQATNAEPTVGTNAPPAGDFIYYTSGTYTNYLNIKAAEKGYENWAALIADQSAGADKQEILNTISNNKLYIWLDTDNSYPNVCGRVLFSNNHITSKAAYKDNKLIKAPDSPREAKLFVDLKENIFSLRKESDKILTYSDLLSMATDPSYTGRNSVAPEYNYFGRHPVKSDIPLFIFETIGTGSPSYQSGNVNYVEPVSDVPTQRIKDRTYVNRFYVYGLENTNSAAGDGCFLSYMGRIMFGPEGYRKAFSKYAKDTGDVRGNEISEDGKAKRYRVSNSSSSNFEVEILDGGAYNYPPVDSVRVVRVTDMNYAYYNTLSSADKEKVTSSEYGFWATPYRETNMNTDGYPTGYTYCYFPMPRRIIPDGNRQAGMCTVYYLNGNGDAINDYPYLVPFAFGSDRIQIYNLDSSKKLAHVDFSVAIGRTANNEIREAATIVED